MQAKKAAGVTVSEMARAMNFERTYLSKWLNEKEDFGMTNELRSKLLSYLGLNLVAFPQGQRA
jgi:transcriptional regulator with XRE-family HTH domain